MASFKARELDVLVATTVIEVGVDVPNATIMIVQEADRFGLAQLHQLRGRVGRGAEQSYCLLVSRAREELTETATERLEAMVATNDGFELAERDLEIRGEGQLLGARQSGLLGSPVLYGSAATRICSSAPATLRALADEGFLADDRRPPPRRSRPLGGLMRVRSKHGWGLRRSASRPSRHSPIPSGIGEHRAEPAAWRMPSPRALLTHITPPGES